jgi:hypothetical protein
LRSYSSRAIYSRCFFRTMIASIAAAIFSSPIVLGSVG